jgi:general secretion pathway protein G
MVCRQLKTINSSQMRKCRLSWGFSYIELIIAAAILALLATAAVPYLEKTIQRKKEAELHESLRELRAAIDAYKSASDQGKIAKMLGDSGYPKRLVDLAEGVTDISDPAKKKIKFIRKIPADPMFMSAEQNKVRGPEETWGKRSYQSDAEDPREGEDVYDVYSLNPATGFNGVPYRDW